MNLNTVLIDLLKENNENAEEEVEEVTKKKKKQRHLTKNPPRQSYLMTRKKSKLNLRVANLCISDCSSDEDEIKKRKR